jgi:Cu2+-exporting ATPase
MCCEGCRAVAELIASVGLSDYYRYRTKPAAKHNQKHQNSWQPFTQTDIAAQYVHDESAELQSANLLITGLRCSACAWLIERRMSSIAEIDSVGVNIATQRVRVAWHTGQLHLSDLLRLLSELGYPALPVNSDSTHHYKSDERRSALRRIGVAGIGMMQVMMYVLPLYGADYLDVAVTHYLQLVGLLLTTPVLFYSGWPFLNSAARALYNRSINMDVPVVLALLMAYGASVYNTLRGIGTVYFDSVTMFVFLLSLGRYMEMMVRHRSSSHGDALAQLQPVSAQRYADDIDSCNTVREVPIQLLKVGDNILLRAGATVPIDGEVISGTSTVDESLLTGEALPQRRTVGNRVLAGSVNVEAPLRVRVTALGVNTLLSGMINLMERAQTEKPRLAQLADQVARYFLQGLIAIAVVVGLWWWRIDPARTFEVVLAVLVVSCPCALSLATPTVIAAATTALARRGLLIVHADAIEQLARIDRLVFDKTGTLSTGHISINHTQALTDMSAQCCLDIAASMELGTEHPLARAFQKYGTACLPVHDVRVVAGEGVQATMDGITYRLGTAAFVTALQGGSLDQHDTAILLGNSTQLLARFTVGDPLRNDAIISIKQLHALNIQTCILSGDAEPTVQAVADTCGISEYQSRCQPADKLHWLQQYQANERVAMVGDGINDAPILSAAAISIAMGAGSGVAHASADAVLLNNSLSTLPQAIILARRARQIMQQNLGWAALYNFTAIPLAAAGLISPWLAAVGMSASSVLVVLNAARLLRKPRLPSPETTMAHSLRPVASPQ